MLSSDITRRRKSRKRGYGKYGRNQKRSLAADWEIQRQSMGKRFGGAWERWQHGGVKYWKIATKLIDASIGKNVDDVYSKFCNILKTENHIKDCGLNEFIDDFWSNFKSIEHSYADYYIDDQRRIQRIKEDYAWKRSRNKKPKLSVKRLKQNKDTWNKVSLGAWANNPDNASIPAHGPFYVGNYWAWFEEEWVKKDIYLVSNHKFKCLGKFKVEDRERCHHSNANGELTISELLNNREEMSRFTEVLVPGVEMVMRVDETIPWYLRGREDSELKMITVCRKE